MSSSDRLRADAVRLFDGPGPSASVFFVDGGFAAYQAREQRKRLVSFQAGDGEGAVCLTLAGAEGRWSSPVTGAFGGVRAPTPVSTSAVFAVVDAATAWLRNEPSAKTATIRQPPDAVAFPSSPAVENALFRSGWRLEQVDINHHLQVSSAEVFRAGLSETKRKALRRLDRSGAVFSKAANSAASLIYQAVAENRGAMGYPMTMTWPQVEALAQAFPDRVSFFGVCRGDALLAGAICLQVTGRHTYVFYWGERPEYRKESPVVLLAAGLVAEAAARGSSIVDLGVSTHDSSPNSGLIAFKEGLGCVASSRRIYALDLSR